MIGKKVYGSGKLPSRILLCGEGPGRQEAAEGKPFVGASGADLDYVFLKRAAKLRREDIYVTNIVKWRTDEEDRDPTPEEIARDEEELRLEIDICSPEIIVAVGKVAAQWFMQQADIDLEKLHGVPIHCSRYPDKILLVVYHPAAGLHQAERYYQLVFWDFERLGQLSRGEIAVLPPPGEVHYSEAGADFRLGDAPAVAVDTEGTVADPWGLSLATVPGWAVVVRGRGGLTEGLRGRRVVGHNWLHDLQVVEALGAPVDTNKLEDTMLAAYLFPWLPRRLKALSFKLENIEQDEYEDVIAQAEKQICEDYLQKVLDWKRCSDCGGTGTVRVPHKRNPNKFRSSRCDKCAGDGTEWPRPEPRIILNDDSTVRLYQPRSLGRTVRAILDSGDGYRQKWENVDASLRAYAIDELGDLREPTLDDVDIDKAIHYSAADADCTLRIWTNHLEPMLKRTGLWRMYEIDKGIIPIIDRMHRNGIRIDRDHFARLHTQFQQEKDKLVSEISGVAAIFSWAAKEDVKVINPGSPLQVAHLLYDLLGLKPIRNKRGTDEKTLETLKIKYKHRPEVVDVIDRITDYRELDKMDGTYAIPIPLAADNLDRIHTRFLLHVTHTGRLASRDPNCFTGATEVLTKDGWVRLDELDPHKMVAQWQDGQIAFVRPTNYIAIPCSQFVRISNQHIDLEVTQDHRCLLLNRKTGRLYVVPASQYSKDAWQLNAAEYAGHGVSISADELRFVIAFQADGSWSREAIDFSFHKKRKADRLRSILSRLNVYFKESCGSGGRFRFYIPSCQLTKLVHRMVGRSKIFDWSMFLALSADQIQIATNEFMKWDGCATRENHYASNIKQNADVVATMYTLSNRRAVVRRYKGKVNDSWQVDVTNKHYSNTANCSTERNYGWGTAYCVSVPSSYLLVRRNGKVMVTGNCQNIPTRTERGRSIRRGFIPRSGCRLVSVDLDQIELRVAAHLSMDENMIDVFSGAETCAIRKSTGDCACHDIHTRTAALIYSKDVFAVTKQERLLAKTINFLILYGGGPGRLQQELNILGVDVTKDDCVGYINGWYEAFPGIRDYIDRCHAMARSQGYVEDLFGRRRYVQGVWSCVDRVQEESLKWAVNFPDQSTAAGILKIWLRRIWDNVLPSFWSRGYYVEPLLTIHDEVIFEAQEEVCQQVIDMVVLEAGRSCELAVPIKAKGSSAMNWSDLK